MRRIALLAVAVLLNGIEQVQAATVFFDDGGTHDIDYQIGAGLNLARVEVRNDAFFGNFTTINLLPGGHIQGSIYVYNNSVAVITGGSISDRISSFDNSQVFIDSGTVRMVAFHSSHVFISGGTVSVEANLNSQVEITGGTISSLIMVTDSQVTMSGGIVGGNIHVGSPSANYTAPILTLIGSNFTINGTPVSYGEYDTMGQDEVHGTLAGTLANGDLLNNGFFIRGDSKIILSPIPEPSADFDEDGDVDGADFLYWQRNDGSESNLTVWQENFGNPSLAATTTSTPEPSTVLLAVFGMASICCFRHRR